MPKPLTTVHEGSTRGKASPNYVNRVKEKAALLAQRRTVKEENRKFGPAVRHGISFYLSLSRIHNMLKASLTAVS